MKYCLYLLIIYQIFLVNSTIPNWNLDNLSVNLFSLSSSDNKYEYELYKADGYVLKKIITKDGDKIKYQNKLFFKVDDYNTIERNVDFERIESKYWNQLGSYRLICPKGSFHPYDFDNNEFIKPFNYDGNWELSCYKHNTGYFIMFYAHNQGNSIYYVEGNNRNIKQVSGTNELYSYKLPEYQEKGWNYEYRMPSIQNKDGYLKIMGYCLIMNSGEGKVNGNTIQEEKGLIEAKSDSQGTISDDNYLYYFTYNDISDFTSGYSTNDYIKYYSDKSYHYPLYVTISNNNDSPLSFVDNVEIKEIKFIPGTQYVYYKLYNSDKDTTYCGLIDVKTNKVVYNIEADIISFTPDYNNHMLAMTSTTLYRICIYKDGDSCSDTACSTLMLDPDGNKCQSSCDSGKIKLIPENICINLNLCDLNIYILNAAETECGLCKNINPDGPIYKLINTTGCLSEIPNNAEYYNEAQKLLKCKTNYHLEGNQCLPDSCYERCETCSEISTNDDDQKCLTCKEGYIFDDETKNCNTPAPTTQIITPTTQEVIPTTQEVIPTTQEVIPTTQEVIPTTQELVPTTQIAPTTQIITPTTQEIIPSTQEIIPTTQIVTEAPTTTPETENILECINKKCLKCSIESNKLELCLSCDLTKYKVVNFTDKYPQYVNCLDKKKVETKYYYDNEINQYRPCYSTCKTCSGHGNLTMQNCIECDSNYMLRPGVNPYNNCVVYSEYYYISPYNEYKPLNNPQCPKEAKYKVIDDNNKTSCIFDCKAHTTHNLLYQGHCLKECPDGITKNGFICLEDPEKIYISEDELYMYTNDTIKIIEILASAYSHEYNYTDNHISLNSNDDLSILLYKNPTIMSNSGLKMPDIDFGDCYEKVKKAYNITGNLIVSIVDKKVKNNPSTFYLFFHPVTGKKLEAGEICKDDNIQIKENLLSMLDEKSDNYELQTYLTQQGINIFDINDPYYKDLCYDFDNPKKRDMALKDRIKETYVNVTLCDDGCINTGIDLQNNVATCDCKFNDITDNDLIHENAALEYVVGEIFELINSSNIMVLKCYKYLLKNFTKSTGAIIILILLILCIVFASVFFTLELAKMKRYISSITEKYTYFLTNFPNLAKLFPPRRKNIKNRSEKIKISKENESEDSANKNINKKSKHATLKYPKLGAKSKINQNSKELMLAINKKNYKLYAKEKFPENTTDNNPFIQEGKQIKKYFKDYLSTSPDDMEFDDAIKKDKRGFCEYFCDSLKENQSIAYTFIASDPINTRMIKFILFSLNLDLYFVVNGLFFSESFISELYHTDEEDENFFSFIPRTIDKVIYTTLVSVVIGYMTDFFFLDENKVKGIFKREKHNKVILKRSIALLIKEIQNRYIAFIIMSLVIIIASLYYILCFNYVYPKTQIEWIKSSILIIIIMQILSVIKCLFETIFRFLSFKFESDNLYKISKVFDGNS